MKNFVEPFFPFRIYCDERRGGSADYKFTPAFNQVKPEFIEYIEGKGKPWEHSRKERFSWYAYDIIILSQTEVEFVCFHMKDNYSGGVGREFHRFRTIVDKSLTKDHIGRRLFERGAIRRERELLGAEAKIYQKYANEERIALGIKF